MALHYLKYRSTMHAPLSEADLRGLLAKARTYNVAHQISGLLLCRHNQFVQVLEGEETELRALYEKIRRDPRHTDLVVLVDAPLPTRHFSAWAMAFRQ